MHDSHFKIVPDIQWTIFRLFFVDSHTRFGFKSLLFLSRILFSSVSSSVFQIEFHKYVFKKSSRSSEFCLLYKISILIITVYLLLSFFRWQLIPSLASFKSPASLDHFFSKPRGRIICRSVVKSKSPKARSETLKIFLKLRINLTRP